MNWRHHIHSDPDVLFGKPVVKNTRLSVEFILELLATGWTEKQILENYPSLRYESQQAVFAFAAECLREEALHCVEAKTTLSGHFTVADCHQLRQRPLQQLS